MTILLPSCSDCRALQCKQPQGSQGSQICRKKERHFWHKINPFLHNCSNSMYLLYMQTSQDLYERLHFNQRLSLSRLSLAQFLSLWCWGVKFGVRTYQLWQLPGQHGWLWMIEVSGSSLLTSVSGCITNFPPFICMWDRQHLEGWQ